MLKLIVIGGGELGRVVIDAARESGKWNVIGFIDPRPCEETISRLNIERLGSDDAIAKFPDAKLVLGVGSIRVTEVRQNVVRDLAQPASRWASIIHPAAIVSPSAEIAEGVLILAGAIVATGANIGRHSIVNSGVIVDHDVNVGEFVHIATKAAIGGGATIEAGAYIGMGASIREHITVTRNTLVGMGAAVVSEFPPESTLVGIPAKTLVRSTSEVSGTGRG